MNELPLFISYRQADGRSLAQWLRRSLHGRTFMIHGAPSDYPVTLSVYVDESVPAAPDWKELLNRELMRARVFLLICTPGAFVEKEREDWVYHEIRWWIENRTDAPLLVAPDEVGIRWVPKIVKQKWPNAEVVRINIPQPSDLPRRELPVQLEAKIARILSGIGYRLQDVSRLSENHGAHPVLNGRLSPPGLFTWEKDLNFRYINCNDNYAQAAGFDSPFSMIGKSDDQMPWRELAEFFRTGDHNVICGIGPPRFHVQEKEIMVDRTADILVVENQLLDNRGECVGVTGYFLDITGKKLVDNPQMVTTTSNGVSLGPEFDRQSLSEKETLVLMGLLRRETPRDIGLTLSMKETEVNSLIEAIRRKLQCSTLGDIIVSATRSGTPFRLLQPIMTPGVKV